ncbi:MAG: NADH-quinone oxidoreductase subunit M [Alphaproteobacteria bacterium]|nr:NADH-quinone oxidoreductase subunit M [Alphaproteobacteria bacterium]
MVTFSLPSVVVFLPLLGALFVLFVRGDEQVVFKNSRHVAFLITNCVFFLTLSSFLWPADMSDTYLMQSGRQIGIDALSMIFVLLISFLTIPAVCIVRRHISFCMREFCFLLLTAESFMLMAVCSSTLFRFFVFWEAAAVPLFLMIAVWGVEKRIFTAYKFFFSDLLGAVFLMPVLFVLNQKTQTGEFAQIAQVHLSDGEQIILFLCLIIAFAFKAPLFPFHAWLSDAQSEAPVPTGILLCGIFSKLVFYAFLRLAFPLMSTPLNKFSSVLLAWAVFSAVYGALITLKQTEIKKIAGFAHLAQVGFLAAGLFCLTPNALKGTLFLCVAQGIAITAYLMSGGSLYERFRAAGIRNPTGLMMLFPYLGATFFLACLAILAVPPLMPFTGQVLIFNSIFAKSGTAAFFLLLSVVLLYASFFRLFTRLLFGEPPERSLAPTDMSWREKTTVVIFGGIFFVLSFVPDFVFTLVQKAVIG